MSLIDTVTSKLPFGKSEETSEYIFALNIEQNKLKSAVWTITGGKLQVLNPAESAYTGPTDLITVTDRLLDLSLGELQVEPSKILFGVPDAWLVEDDLKPPYLKILRDLVKALDLKPLAYVATSHALAHFLEKQDGALVTAILVGIEEETVAVSIIRAGKVAGSRLAKRSSNFGEEIEKALLSFTDVEVLPSRMLVYGDGDLEKHKNNLMSYSWMTNLSFLHFPKIEALEKDIDVKSVALAGAVEIDSNVSFAAGVPVAASGLSKTLPPENPLMEPSKPQDAEQDLGFIQGDVMEKPAAPEVTEESNLAEVPEEEAILPGEEHRTATPQDSVVMRSQDNPLPARNDWEAEDNAFVPPQNGSRFPKIRLSMPILGIMLPVMLVAGLIAGYLFLVKANVTIFVEPRVLEKDTQVTADPSIKKVDEQNKKIPGKIIETDVSDTAKVPATGKKQIGDPAKGTVVIYNATSQAVSLKSGTELTADGGAKFTLNSSVQIASKSASAAAAPTKSDSIGASAVVIGADGNIPSDTEMKVGSFSKAEVVAKSEGNFSGGTSKDVVVVTDSDQKKLLATLAASMRKKAVEQLSKNNDNKDLKILEEALSENITKKSYNKNINDQASELSLNLTIHYKGTSYLDSDLKSIVSKLVETNVPGDFELNLAETETQADVSKLEKDGTLIFLARFKAKLTPKLDIAKIRSQIKGQSIEKSAEIIKSYENVLESDIKITPNLPAKIARLPFLGQNIKIEVSLK